jgi:Na+-driven multidrug efflux pump
MIVLLPTFLFVCFEGVLEGQARPQWGTLSAVLGTWLVGLTTSYVLAIGFDMQMQGLWLGLTCVC